MPESMSEQVIYKLGQIEAKVESGFESLKERMDSIHKDSEALEGRVQKLEVWQTRLATVIGLVALVVGPSLSYLVNHL